MLPGTYRKLFLFILFNYYIVLSHFSPSLWSLRQRVQSGPWKSGMQPWWHLADPWQGSWDWERSCW
jgi:hypothetical protein